jgi:hypothetical protein
VISALKTFTDRFLGRGEATITVPSFDGALKPNQILESAETVGTGSRGENASKQESRAARETRCKTIEWFRADRRTMAGIKIRKILFWFQADLGRPVPAAKIFLFPSDPNQIYTSRHPVPHEGRIAIVTDVGTGCDGRDSNAAQTFCADERC